MLVLSVVAPMHSCVCCCLLVSVLSSCVLYAPMHSCICSGSSCVLYVCLLPVCFLLSYVTHDCACACVLCLVCMSCPYAFVCLVLSSCVLYVCLLSACLCFHVFAVCLLVLVLYACLFLLQVGSWVANVNLQLIQRPQLVFKLLLKTDHKLVHKLTSCNCDRKATNWHRLLSEALAAIHQQTSSLPTQWSPCCIDIIPTWAARSMHVCPPPP